MPVRVSAWAIYQVFETGDQQQVFVGVVSDKQWKDLCAAFDLKDLAADRSLDTNNDRVAHKDRLLPIIKEVFRRYTKAELMAKLEKVGLPFAPIARPEDLFDDPHLKANAGLLPITVTDGPRAGQVTQLPALPLEMAGHRFGVHQDVPRAGQHTREVLREAGYSDAEIDALASTGAVEVEAA
jgi:crotonobetainyl-CoA:carnitine CoA-transferase CaiB-like acyl-CoA transferase